mgnify:CR=1 FL=1
MGCSKAEQAAADRTQSCVPGSAAEAASSQADLGNTCTWEAAFLRRCSEVWYRTHRIPAAGSIPPPPPPPFAADSPKISVHVCPVHVCTCVLLLQLLVSEFFNNKSLVHVYVKSLFHVYGTGRSLLG